MNLEAKYVARHTMFGEPTLIHFISMAQMVEWIEYNNMVLGIPHDKTPYFSVEHADGSELSADELAIVHGVSSLKCYQGRCSAVTKRPLSAYHPETGIIHTAIGKILKSIRGTGS